LQKLYSEFPGGYPGLGLLFLRLVACGMLLTFEWRGLAVTKAAENHTMVWIALAVLLVSGGVLVLLGFLTTVGSVVLGSIEGAWGVYSAVTSIAGHYDPWPYPLLIVGVLTSLVLAGPGGFSLDAYFFGPKRIRIPM
jgi:uncharacterized membrane protein YphA (DoxX/SURF4 family)